MRKNKNNRKSVEMIFEEEYGNLRREIRTPNVLVAGYTGIGKTSLIQAICGRRMVPDSEISHGKPGTIGYKEYKSELINVSDSQGFEPGVKEEEFLAKTRKYVRTKQEDPNVDNHIHLVWYAISGVIARVTDFDKQLISKIFSNVIVLITRADQATPQQLKAMTTVLLEAGVSADKIITVSSKTGDGIKSLLDLSIKMLPETYRDAMLSAQLVDIERKSEAAESLIHKAAIAAAAVGAANPLPVSDCALITPIQVNMVLKLGNLYGQTEARSKTLYMTVLAELAGIETAAGLTKLIPVVGQIINGAVAGGITEALGFYLKNYFIKCAEADVKGQEKPPFIFDYLGFKKFFNLTQKESNVA